MRFTLKQLEYFVAAGEAGSITFAAEKVNISQPSVSAAIAHLEAEFGVQLFIRHHAQGLSLTPAGQRFLLEARSLLAHADDLQQSARGLADELSGELDVGCFITFALLIFLFALPLFVLTRVFAFIPGGRFIRSVLAFVLSGLWGGVKWGWRTLQLPTLYQSDAAALFETTVPALVEEVIRRAREGQARREGAPARHEFLPGY